MKNLLQIILAFGVVVCYNSLCAQTVPSIEWQKCLGGSDDDQAYCVTQTSDGAFIVAGWSWSTDGDISGNIGYSDYWIVKLDTGGNLLWQKSLGGNSFDNAYCIQPLEAGFIVAGLSYSHDGDVTGNHGYPVYSDYWVVKLDATGNIIWQKCLGGGNDEYIQ